MVLQAIDGGMAGDGGAYASSSQYADHGAAGDDDAVANPAQIE